MLFDLRGKRRRLIQVVYACLAILMGGSLVLFGIGSDAPGGILDGLGLSDGSGPSSPQYEQALDEAEERLAANPNDSEALLEVARNHYLIATLGITVDPQTGERQVSSDARESLDEAVAAWNRYLETDPRRPDAGMARNISQVNEIRFSEALERGEVREALVIAEQTAEAARIAVRQSPTAPDLSNMARYLYISGKEAEADRARERAIELVDAQDREQIERVLNRQARQAKRLNRQLEEFLESGDAGTGRIEDPFGGLGAPAP